MLAQVNIVVALIFVTRWKSPKSFRFDRKGMQNLCRNKWNTNNLVLTNQTEQSEHDIS